MWNAEDANSLNIAINKSFVYQSTAIDSVEIRAHAHTPSALAHVSCLAHFQIFIFSFILFVHFSVNVQLALKKKMWWLNWTIASKGHMQVPYNGKCTGIVMVLGQ